jgi:hypothetical protein
LVIIIDVNPAQPDRFHENRGLAQFPGGNSQYLVVGYEKHTASSLKPAQASL